MDDAEIIVALTAFDRQSGLGSTDMQPALISFPPQTWWCLVAPPFFFSIAFLAYDQAGFRECDITMHQADPARHDGPDLEWDAHPAFRQMSLAAWFSAYADQHNDLDLVAREACKVAAVGVRARFVGLLQFRANQRAFVLQADVGWQGTEAGSVRQAADLTTTAGIAWHTGQLTHFRSLPPCGRVRAIRPMRTQGIQSVLSVPVRGEAGKGFGVLEVGSLEVGKFTRHDASFLQALAHDLAAAVGRQVATLSPR
ncbi:MAG: GAF domain-containing protein [Janthinobacterium lividum]